MGKAVLHAASDSWSPGSVYGLMFPLSYYVGASRLFWEWALVLAFLIHCEATRVASRRLFSTFTECRKCELPFAGLSTFPVYLTRLTGICVVPAQGCKGEVARDSIFAPAKSDGHGKLVLK